MFEKFIILNKKPKNIFIFYVTSLLLLLLIILIFINFKFTPYFLEKAEINFLENNYYLKLNIDISKLKFVSSGKKIIINSDEYSYSIYKVIFNDNNVVVYLDIFNLPNSYKINGFCLLIKISGNKERLLDGFRR